MSKQHQRYEDKPEQPPRYSDYGHPLADMTYPIPPPDQYGREFPTGKEPEKTSASMNHNALCQQINSFKSDEPLDIDLVRKLRLALSGNADTSDLTEAELIQLWNLVNRVNKITRAPFVSRLELK